MDINKWINYQNIIAKKIITTDCLPEYTFLIGGLDISFDKNDNNHACGYITIYDMDQNKIVYEDHEIVDLKIPYISGFLGFREFDVYKILLDRLKIIQPNFYPHVLMVDGFGILHPRGAGSASQLGYEFDLPSVGVGKTLLYLDGLNEKAIKRQCQETCRNKGDYILLKGQFGNIYGAAVRTSNESYVPVYASVGHKICLETAIDLVVRCSKFRIPEPIRNSDIRSKLYL